MKYQLKEEIPSVENYINIRLRAGLSRKSEQAAAMGLPNSLYSVVVYSDESPVGIGRIIGDGGCFFEVTDIAVLSEHQKQGLGVMIMEPPHFYEKFGFTLLEMPKSSGMYMRIV